MSELIQSFIAFNTNGANHLIYIMSINAWFILIAVSALVMVIMQMKEETDYAVREEQNIL